MQKDIEDAVQEAKNMCLSTEQTIKFIMNMTGCDRQTAKHATTKKYEFLY